MSDTDAEERHAKPFADFLVQQFRAHSELTEGLHQLMFSLECEDCGKVTIGASEAKTIYYHSKHSCERQRQLWDRAERVKARKKAGGPKRECLHKQAQHEHGTRQAYVLDRCRCAPCRKANSVHESARAKAKAYGRYDSCRVDAPPVREHVQTLMANGIGIKRIAALTGVSTGTLSKLLYGVPSKGVPPRIRCRPDVAEKLLAVRPRMETVANGALVDGTGTHRRLQALVAIGYSMSNLGDQLGIQRGNMNDVTGGRTQVTAATARKVTTLYERLWNKPNEPTDMHAKAAAQRARNHAAAHGWVQPMAWDDEMIDDPTARPTGTDTRTRTSARAADLIEDVEHMLITNASPDEIAQRLRRAERDLDRILCRAGRHDLASWLRTGEQSCTYRHRESAA